MSKTLYDFLNIRNNKTKLILTKNRARKHYILWWELSDDHFLNVQFSDTLEIKPNTSIWVVRQDAEYYINELLKEGYNIKEKK